MSKFKSLLARKWAAEPAISVKGVTKSVKRKYHFCCLRSAAQTLLWLNVMDIMPKMKFVQCASFVFLTAVATLAARGEPTATRPTHDTNVTRILPIKVMPPLGPVSPASNAPVTEIAVLTPPLTNGVRKQPIALPPTVPVLPASNAPVTEIAVLTPPLTNVVHKQPITVPPTGPVLPIVPVPAANLGSGPTLAPVLSATNLILTPVKSTPYYSKHAGSGVGQFQIQVTGAEGQSVVLQASSDLIHWISLSTNTLGGTPLSLVDGNAGSYPSRFYRAVAMPLP